MEQRQGHRHSVQLSIAFSGDLISGRGMVMNLSASGCGIQTSRIVTGGVYLHLFLYLPAEEVPLKVELAAVRWADGYNCGIEFIRMSGQQQQRLQDYLEDLARVPATWGAQAMAF